MAYECHSERLLVATGLPPALARRPGAVVRPRDLTGAFARPRPEVARLVRAGLLFPLARGYYARVPMERQGDPTWLPDLSAAALGIGQADAGMDDAVLMHLSAARLLGVLPRDLAVAVVALDRQRAPLHVLGGTVHFVRRDVAALDVQRVITVLGPGWVTTPEQTLLDLAHRPDFGGVDQAVVGEALTALTAIVDWPSARRLADIQRRRATLQRVAPRAVAAATTATGVPAAATS
jgi:hypothetical protein